MKTKALAFSVALLAGCGGGGGGGGVVPGPSPTPTVAPAPREQGQQPQEVIPTTTITIRNGDAFTPGAPMDFNITSALGEFDYQSYGTWARSPTDFVIAMATSTGQATPANALPTTGTATYMGSARGIYGVAGNGERVGTTAAMSAQVNFETREIGFATSNTITSGERSMPELNISGTLRYSAGVNNFSGAVQNQSGDMTGQAQGRFYGPAAQEIGGVYSLSSAGRIHILTGGFGGKKQ
jgi:transferrin binding protein